MNTRTTDFRTWNVGAKPRRSEYADKTFRHQAQEEQRLKTKLKNVNMAQDMALHDIKYASKSVRDGSSNIYRRKSFTHLPTMQSGSLPDIKPDTHNVYKEIRQPIFNEEKLRVRFADNMNIIEEDAYNKADNDNTSSSGTVKGVTDVTIRHVFKGRPFTPGSIKVKHSRIRDLKRPVTADVTLHKDTFEHSDVMNKHPLNSDELDDNNRLQESNPISNDDRAIFSDDNNSDGVPINDEINAHQLKPLRRHRSKHQFYNELSQPKRPVPSFRSVRSRLDEEFNQPRQTYQMTSNRVLNVTSPMHMDRFGASLRKMGHSFSPRPSANQYRKGETFGRNTTVGHQPHQTDPSTRFKSFYLN